MYYFVPPRRHVRFKLLLMYVRKIGGHVSIEFESKNGVGWAALEAYAKDRERLRIALELLGCQIREKPVWVNMRTRKYLVRYEAEADGLETAVLGVDSSGWGLIEIGARLRVKMCGKRKYALALALGMAIQREGGIVFIFGDEPEPTFPHGNMIPVCDPYDVEFLAKLLAKSAGRKDYRPILKALLERIGDSIDRGKVSDVGGVVVDGVSRRIVDDFLGSISLGFGVLLPHVYAIGYASRMPRYVRDAVIRYLSDSYWGVYIFDLGLEEVPRDVWFLHYNENNRPTMEPYINALIEIDEERGKIVYRSRFDSELHYEDEFKPLWWL